MKTPETEHTISLARNLFRIQALFHGHVIADTTSAVILKETGYKAVCYFPREDVEMAYLRPSDHKTRCPYKGQASYFTLARDGDIAENAVWTYEDPIASVDGIRGLVAFYPNQVEIHRVDEDETRHDIADIILHTDSGAGRSQKEHWPANVQAPLG